MLLPETVLKRLDRVDECIVNNDTITELTNVIQLCKKELDKHQEEVSISAVQVGRKKRLFVVRFEDEYKTFINPIVQKAENLRFVIEQSIITRKTFLVLRPEHLLLAYQSGTGVPQSNVFSGQEVISVISQNIDLLDGICDELYGLEVDDDFINASDEEKAAVISVYIDSLKNSNLELNDEIKNDEILNSIKKNIEFNTALARGEIKLEQLAEEPTQFKYQLNRKMRRLLDKLVKRKDK